MNTGKQGRLNGDDDVRARTDPRTEFQQGNTGGAVTGTSGGKSSVNLRTLSCPV